MPRILWHGVCLVLAVSVSVAQAQVETVPDEITVPEEIVAQIEEFLYRPAARPSDVTIEYDLFRYWAPEVALSSHVLSTGNARGRLAARSRSEKGVTIARRMRVDIAADGSTRVELANDFVNLEDAPPADPSIQIYVVRGGGGVWEWSSDGNLLEYPGTVGMTNNQVAHWRQIVEDYGAEALALLEPGRLVKRRLRTAELTSAESAEDTVTATFVDGDEQWEIGFEVLDGQLWLTSVLYTDGRREYVDYVQYVQESWAYDAPNAEGARFPRFSEYWSGPVADLGRVSRRSSRHDWSTIRIIDQTGDESFAETFVLPPELSALTEQTRAPYQAISPGDRTMLSFADLQEPSLAEEAPDDEN